MQSVTSRAAPSLDDGLNAAWGAGTVFADDLGPFFVGDIDEVHPSPRAAVILIARATRGRSPAR
jgi:hypothetical protein